MIRTQITYLASGRLHFAPRARMLPSSTVQYSHNEAQLRKRLLTVQTFSAVPCSYNEVVDVQHDAAG